MTQIDIEDIIASAQANDSAPPPLAPLLLRFLDWHRANPQMWRLFERFALEAAHGGRRRFSGWLIVNRMRWEVDIVWNKDEPFKISNDFIAIFGRMFARLHPAHANLFRFGRMKRVGDDEWPELWRRLGKPWI